MYQTNPFYSYVPPQQRLQMMENQYSVPNATAPTYPQQAYQMQQQPMLLKGRPVSNMEEANAALIDFDGTLFVFPDKTHDCIYTKQLGLDGNMIFTTYTRAQKTTPEEQNMKSYVTQEEFDGKIKSVEDSLKSLEQKLQSGKGGTK